MFEIKDIQDKTSVAFFWLTNFSLLFAAVFQANPAVFICKKQWKISQSKICSTVLILNALYILTIFFITQIHNGVIQTFCVQILTIDVLSRGSKLKRYMVKFKGNFKRKTSTPLTVFFLFLIFGKRSYISSPTNLTSLLFQRVILNKNSENQIYLAKGS